MEEIDHKVSKSASNAFFELAKKWFHPLIEAKNAEMIFKDVPQFAQIRKNLNDKEVPKVSIKVAYKDKLTEEIIVLDDLQSVPTTSYPRSTHQKLFEMATVDVSIIIIKNVTQFSLFLDISLVFRFFPACFDYYENCLHEKRSAVFLRTPNNKI